ncbi:hypothetical protein [Luteimonas sp. MC1572]|uniref:hypothetical protein n=1 Tax=Luteimonas sp. MC1572 TaxID=2799325 RepID=UPI0018F062F5|nr:hypothetical protein [Luteimonas sp. MC1572]MBJ6982702.1 hypothetical protein [Luteimonas sp. MC1572]
MRVSCAVAIAMLAACQLSPATATDSAAGATFPHELRGVWDAYPMPCVADEPSDSDMRFTISEHVRGNYEDTDTLVSIERVATAPMTWRVVATTSLDPSDDVGEATIYVLKMDTLAVTNGERAEVYIRCK